MTLLKSPLIAALLPLFPLLTQAQPPSTSPDTTSAYLGITAKPADPDLRAQLNLPEGVGLTVAFVDKDGPAATAGVKPGDVLQKLDDQLLINPQQFVVLIHTHQPGDHVKLTLIHQAKVREATAQLAGKPAENTPGPEAEAPNWNNFLPGAIPAPMTLPNFGAGTQLAMAFSDNKYSANVTTDKSGSKTMMVKDSNGHLITEGPVNTEEQWNAFPQDVRQHLDMFHNMIFGKQPGAVHAPKSK